jgi:hypothetical protein
MKFRTARLSKSSMKHLLAVDAVREARLPDFDRGRNVVPGAVEDEVRESPGHKFLEGKGFEAM